jgi:hypothetical protein
MSGWATDAGWVDVVEVGEGGGRWVMLRVIQNSTTHIGLRLDEGVVDDASDEDDEDWRSRERDRSIAWTVVIA